MAPPLNCHLRYFADKRIIFDDQYHGHLNSSPSLTPGSLSDLPKILPITSWIRSEEKRRTSRLLDLKAPPTQRCMTRCRQSPSRFIWEFRRSWIVSVQVRHTPSIAAIRLAHPDGVPTYEGVAFDLTFEKMRELRTAETKNIRVKPSAPP